MYLFLFNLNVVISVVWQLRDSQEPWKMAAGKIWLETHWAKYLFFLTLKVCVFNKRDLTKSSFFGFSHITNTLTHLFPMHPFSVP